jgi:arylformamidase
VTIEELGDIAHSVPGARISATHLSLYCHAGTHVDAARHFFPDGRSIDEYEPARFVCRGVALDVPREGPHELSADEILAVDPGIAAGDAVLLRFGYAERYTDASYHDHPFLSKDAAELLVARGVGVVGTDTPTPDCPAARRETPFPYPVHDTLLRADVLIVENLGPGLAAVVGRAFRFVMAPMTIPGADASPVVPLALIPRAS